MTPAVEILVAMGASAGGLKPLQEFLSQLKPLDRVAVVVALHQSPQHPSELVHHLRRATSLQVEEASDGSPLKPGHVFVIPPHCDATIGAGCLVLTPTQPRLKPVPSIDLLFVSVVAAFGDRSVGVVLSGAGSDGAFGLRAIRAVGGLTLVQSPESAPFAAMPNAAISLGRPDLIADPQILGSRFAEWCDTGVIRTQGSSDPVLPALSLIADLLLEHTGVDFSLYKENTLLRQIRRRMSVHHLSSMEAYLDHLSSHPQESHALMSNLLIHVTSFFRDPDGFEALTGYLQQQFSRPDFPSPYRIWVPGCASGEEAYSIGMLVGKLMGYPENLSEKIKIFATDLDEPSLAIGRRATYLKPAVQSIPEDLRDRYLQEKMGHYQIHKNLRSCVVFAKHNVFQDPPFPDIDLVLCRNLLIYFMPPLQQRVIDLFGFSLRPGGLLFLGASETLVEDSGFRVLNPMHRVYERTEQRRTRMGQSTRLSLRIQPSLQLAASSLKEDHLVPVQHTQLMDALVRACAQPCLIVDQHGQLIEVVGDVGPYCRLPEGRLTGAALNFLRDELQVEAKALFLQVKAGMVPVRGQALHVSDLPSPLRLEALPLQVAGFQLIVLLFIQEQEPTSPVVSASEMTDVHSVFSAEIERLEQELFLCKDTLGRSLANLEQLTEAFEASSEELQASSDELQSSNEELKTANEDLCDANDQLQLLNQRLQDRGAELEGLNNDLENIQSSLNEGMVIVDEAMRVTRFSPSALRVFGLVEGDLGSPLDAVPSTLAIHGLRESLLAVIQDGRPVNLWAQGDDLSCLIKLTPYRDGEHKIRGAILTITDLSELFATRYAAEHSLQEFDHLVAMLDQVVWKRDHTLTQILYISPRVEPLLGWSPAELCASPNLLDSAIVAADQHAVMAARDAGHGGWDITYRITRCDGAIRTVREVGTGLHEETGEGTVVGILTDITDQQMLLQRSQFLASAFRTLMESEEPPIALLDGSLRLVLSSERFAPFLDPLALGSQAQAIDPLSSQRFQSLAAQVLEHQQPQKGLFFRCRGANGDLMPFTLDLLPIVEAGMEGVLVKVHPGAG